MGLGVEFRFFGGGGRLRGGDMVLFFGGDL